MSNSSELLTNYRHYQAIYEKAITTAKSDIVKLEENKLRLKASIPNLDADDEQLKILSTQLDKMNQELAHQEDITEKGNKKLTAIKKKITGLENAIPQK